VDGQNVPLYAPGRRLMALCSLYDRALSRAEAAGLLWPSEPETRALSNLRATLWRLPRGIPRLVVAERETVRVNPDVWVDVTESRERAAHILLDEAVDDTLLNPVPFSFELLPGWFGDDWLYFFQERWRQLRLHALEAIARRLTAARRFAVAVDAALQAVSGEPLRESAQRVLIEVHVAEGNLHEARQQLDRYELLLAGELGLKPPADLFELVRSLPGATMA
jgi:DNA-binding SARP family transcriptional activator